MHGSGGSRARLADVHSISRSRSSLVSSPSKHSISLGLASGGAGDLRIPVQGPLSPLSPRPPPGSGGAHSHSHSPSHYHAAQGGGGGGSGGASGHASASSMGLSGGGRTGSFRSVGVACEVRLKECIERSRVADRLLRAPTTNTTTANEAMETGGSAAVSAAAAASSAPSSDHRSASEGQIDRSISALALSLFAILDATRDAFPSPSLYAQVVAVLDQLVWSEQTRVVHAETHEGGRRAAGQGTGGLARNVSSATIGMDRSASTATLSPAQQQQQPSSSSLLSSPFGASLTAVERITNYELNLLHARSETTWRARFHAQVSREQALQSRMEAMEKENAALAADVTTLLREAAAAADVRRELERAIQSLDGRLHIARQESQAQAGQVSALQAHLSGQQESILHVRQELLSTRRELEVSRSSAAAHEAHESLRAELRVAQTELAKSHDNLASVHALYNAMMATAHKSIQSKDALGLELDAARLRVQELTQARADILRPYTPRPDWNAVYKQHLCELTPTLLLQQEETSGAQIRTLMEYLCGKDAEIAAVQRSLSQTLDVQQNCKRDLAKARRDLEIAIRSNINATNRLRAGGGGGGGDFAAGASNHSRSCSFLYVKPKGTSRYFLGAGTGKEVPPFLRATGKIRNRHLSKKDTELVVRDVWARKQAHDRERGKLDLNLSDFLYFYLKNKYGLPSLVVDWGYNLMDSLERFRWDADCELFFKILIGEVPEEAYYDQLLLTHTLTNLFQALEVIRAERKVANLIPGAVVGTLPLDYLFKVLRLLFPHKADEAFESICAALSLTFSESPRAAQDYSLLFRENRSMSETGFVEEIRDQHLYEIENLCIQLTEEIVLLPREIEDEQDEEEQDSAAGSGAGSDGGVGSEGKTRLFHIHNAWVRLDPLASVESMDKLISRALRLPAPLDPSMLVDPIEFCKMLFSASLVNYTCNFDATAPLKLASIPVPDVILQTNAAAAAAGINEANATTKSGRKIGRRSSMERKGASAAAAASAAATAAVAAAAAALSSAAASAASNDEESKQSISSSTSKPAIKADSSCLGGGSGAVVGSSASSANLLSLPSAASMVKKEFLLSSPKILRLRARFGLDPSPTEMVFLPRGPNFLDPASSLMRHAAGAGLVGAAAAGATDAANANANASANASSSTPSLVPSDAPPVREVETLLAEKAQLDVQRMGERIRLARAQENSLKAIQGIGVIKRRPATNNDGRGTATNAEEKSAGLSHSSSRGSIHTATAAASSVSASASASTLPAHLSSSSGSVDLTALQSAVSGVRSNRSSIGSAIQTAAAASFTSRRASFSGPLALATQTATAGAVQSAPVSSAIPSATPAAPVSVGGASPPRYRSSFFAAPAIHAADAVHERVGAGAPPSQHSGLVRRYADRRKTASTGSIGMAPEEVAAAVATAAAVPAAASAATLVAAPASMPDVAPSSLAPAAAAGGLHSVSGSWAPSVAPAAAAGEPAVPTVVAAPAPVSQSGSTVAPALPSSDDADLSLDLSADELGDLDDL